MSKPVLYIDMDGVIVDFPETINEVPLSIRDECSRWCKSNQKHHSDYPRIFSSLKPKFGAVNAVKALQSKYAILLLSSAPWDNISSWTDKRVWVEKNLPMLGRKCLILSHRKDLNRGRFWSMIEVIMELQRLVITKGKIGFILEVMNSLIGFKSLNIL